MVLLAHRAHAIFVTAPTRITLAVLVQTGLTARATCSLVSLCLPHQQLVRATIGALVLGCPPLGNSQSHVATTLTVHTGRPPHVRLGPYACAQVSIIDLCTRKRVRDANYVTFLVRWCARAAWDDVYLFCMT